jgi:hypothetical protein
MMAYIFDEEHFYSPKEFPHFVSNVHAKGHSIHLNMSARLYDLASKMQRPAIN